MKRNLEASLLSALVVAAGIALTPVTGLAQSTTQLKQMSVEQLLQRQQVLRREVEEGAGNRQKRQLRRVQRELDRRELQASQPEQKAKPKKAKPEQQAKPAKTKPEQQAQPKKAEPKQSAEPQQAKPAQPQQVESQKAEQSAKADRQARRYLRNKTKVRSMSDARLRARIRDGRNVLRQDGLSRKLERQVRRQVQIARNEAARRANVAKTKPGPTAPEKQVQPAQQAQEEAVNRKARRYLRNKTNVRDMNDNQLRVRIRDGRNLLREDGLRDKLARDIRRQVRIARDETTRRSAAAKPPQAQPQPDVTDDANRLARRYLRDKANVRDMNTVRLRARIRNGRDLLRMDGLRSKLSRQVRSEVRAAQTELERRSQSAGQPATGGTDAQARDLLADTRPAASLRTPQLRRRLDRARRIMRDRDLNRRLFQRLRRMARNDRDELRERIARSNRDRAEQREARQDLRQLLRDRRDVRDLNDRQLQARITSARDLLTSASLGPRQKDRLRVILREARREKRRRLIVRRADRRERLRRNRDNTQIIIQIPPVRIGPDRADIAAAEADDELLERQLVAPPRRRIERRYTRQDFRSGLDLSRDTMPAIEVDTIRFGFNEAFVREEEIPQLERIGEIIERIVAGNSGEVFLIEGHTDAVGSAAYNQSLSFERASAVREAMLQYFNVESENIEIVGYGERFLKINTPEEEQENRRVTIRRITPLLASQ